MHPGKLEAGGDEVLEQPAGVELLDDGVRGNTVTCHKRVAALHPQPTWMIVRQRGVYGDIVGVDHFDIVMRQRGELCAFQLERILQGRPDEIRQYAAALTA